MRDPHKLARDKVDESTEFGWGAGRFPHPGFDYSEGGTKSRIPIADPDRNAQLLELAAIRRMDLADPDDQPSPFVAGNPDRYGAQPPLVREIRSPRYTPASRSLPDRMRREW